MEFKNGILQRNLTIGEVSFNAMTKEELVSKIYDMPLDGPCPYVVFAGMQAVVDADHSETVREVQKAATICAVDGMPVNWVAKHRGLRSERCGGPDIMRMIMQTGLKKNSRHFFYGSTPEVLDALRSKLNEEYPGINIVGMYSPPFRELSPEEEKETEKMINDAAPDFVWVGLGAPKQEIWMKNHRTVLKHTRLMGVGAAFNFLSGTVSRAPVWMQKCGLEWLYRLIREGGHLRKRYVQGAPQFLRILMRGSKNKDKQNK